MHTFIGSIYNYFHTDFSKIHSIESEYDDSLLSHILYVKTLCLEFLPREKAIEDIECADVTKGENINLRLKV